MKKKSKNKKEGRNYLKVVRLSNMNLRKHSKLEILKIYLKMKSLKIKGLKNLLLSSLGKRLRNLMLSRRECSIKRKNLLLRKMKSLFNK